MLKDTKLTPDFSITVLAEQTEGLSGSDLRELCRNAAMVPVREFMRSSTDNPKALEKGQLEVCTSEPLTAFLVLTSHSQGFDLRPLSVDDFFAHDGSSPLPPRATDVKSQLDDEPLD